MRVVTVTRPRAVSVVCVGIALVVGGFAGGSSPGLASEPAAVDAIVVEQSKVFPAEFNGDVRALPAAPSGASTARPYRPLLRGPPSTKVPPSTQESTSAPEPPGGPRPPMPSSIQNFAGLSFNDTCSGRSCGDGWPPDPNGDVGPNHYIEAVNTAIGIYSKTGTLLASFTENALWSGVGTTPCNGQSQGDPVVIYDWLADRFVLTWFAFGVNGSGNPISPFYQCIAASKTSDPVAGGYWLYAIRMDPGGAGLPPVGDLNDYDKFGLWHDCLYLGANEFTFPAGSYDGVSFASFSRSDLYSGAPLTFALGWLPPASNAFTLVPSNNQGKGANAVQPGTPNYFVSESGSAFAFEVRKFTAGTNCGGGGTLSAPTNVTQTSYSFASLGNEVPQPFPATASNLLDNIDDRVMQKVQYRKVGAVESLWVTHNVDTASGPTGLQWAQINVTGGTIVTTPIQQQIYAPDTTLWRWMGSLAVDNQGNMALGYSTSNATAPNFPSIAYSGRLATDPLNTLPQTEVQLIAGAGSQVNNCGGAPCHRWGDYTAMSLDPADSCTFWYTNEYYSSQANGTIGNWQNRIGSFKFPSCTPQALGLVYKPLEPCRIMDTRNASGASGVQGPITGGSLKHIPGFITAGSNWGQYGQPAPLLDCGLTNPPGSAIQAVAIVITILNPNFDAFLGVGDVNDLNTTLSTVALNYTHGQGLSTMYLVPQVASNVIYFALPAGLSANLIFDVVGYYVLSDATALQCTTQSSAPATIGAGSTGSATSPACGAGYALTSGSCDSDSFSMKLVADKASGQAWFCSANNSGGSAAHLTATVNCCRVPGK
jgi:hypothetical protein